MISLPASYQTMADQIQEDHFSSDEEFDDDSATDSSSDVDERLAEDDVFDEQFLKCYSALKKKDEKIYNKDVKFFNDEHESSSCDDGESSMKSEAPKMTLLDLQLKAVKEGVVEPELENPKIDLNQQVSKSYYEKELEEIKRSIEQVGEGIDSDSDDELLVVKAGGENEMKPKPKSKISSILDRIENEDEDISHLKQIWSNPKELSEEDRYLRDYILNKRYMPTNVNTTQDDKNGFFSKNIDELSDVEEDETNKVEHEIPIHHSEEKDFDKIARIPRNSTKTIRDMVEKQEKQEKRLKKLKKEKNRKKALAEADCEDIIGDMPTRFHYRETEPNDFGLTAEELLMATDEELDQWVNLKECFAYKSREEELAQKKKFDAIRNNMELKRKIFKSIYGDEASKDDQPVDSEPHDSSGKKKKNRKRKRNTDSETSLGAQDTSVQRPERATTDELKKLRKKKKKVRGLNHKKFAKLGVAPDRLLSYGLSKTKLKKTKLL